jgi:hypothetical protein
MKIDGRCYCGWVTFKAEAEPENDEPGFAPLRMQPT